MTTITQALLSYTTKWKGSPYTSCTSGGSNIVKEDGNPAYNVPNIYAAPQGSCPGMAPNNLTDDYIHIPFKANPIRHYRKSYTNAQGKIPINTVDLPGSTIFRNTTLCDDGDCCGLAITSDYTTKKNLTTNCSNNTGTCGTPGNTLAKVRNGTTCGTKYCNERKNYYTDSRAYLKARCSTYAKKQMTPRPCSPSHNDPGCYLSGCATSKSEIDASGCATGNHINNVADCCQKTYYNPCNTKFSVNYAVDSSTRLRELSRITVNKAAKSQAKNFGKASAAASVYGSNKAAPNVVKRNYAPPYKRVHTIDGHRTLCFC